MTERKGELVKFFQVLLLLAVMSAGLGGICLGQEEAVNLEELFISRVEAAGNVTVAKETILSEVRARAGQKFGAESAVEDASRIAKIEGVEYAYYTTTVEDGKVVLTFVAVERKLVRSIAFKGNKLQKAGKLSKELGFKKGDYLDIFLARNAVESITKLYKKRGHAFVEVALVETGLETGNLVYHITEGPRVKIKKLTFDGDEQLTSEALKKVVKSKPKKLLVVPIYYKADQLQEDLDKVKAAYQKKGFWNIKAEASAKFIKDREQAEITFTIEEGDVYPVERISITGNEFFDDETLREGLKLSEGEYYSQDKGAFDTKKIRSHYLEKGFIYAQVEHERLFTEAGGVIADFNIVEGSRFRIGEVIISGNELVYDKVIRRVLDEKDFKPGEWYNADGARGDGQGDLEKEVQRAAMTESTFIKSVGDKPDQRDAHVNIIEGQSGSVMFTAGVGTDLGVIGGLSYTERNFDISKWPKSMTDLVDGRAFRGAGQIFKASVNPGIDQSSFSVSFTEPFLYDQPVALNVGAYGYERGRESYDEKRMRGSVGIEKRYDDGWRRGFSFKAENINVNDIDLYAPKEIYDMEGDNLLCGLMGSVGKSTTNNSYMPSEGYNFDTSYEQNFGDHTFGVLEATQRWYKTLREDLAERKTILETKVYAGTIIGDAPAFEKFYAGGSRSIRGFEYRGVSTRGKSTDPATPNLKEDPIGSDWVVTGNTEIAIPLNTDVLSFLLFADAGLIDSGGPRVSVGFGIQVMLPQWFGPVPMRFEIATPLLDEDEDETQPFSFSVGALF